MPFPGDDDAGSYTVYIVSADTTETIDVATDAPRANLPEETPVHTRIRDVLAVLLFATLGVAAYMGYPRWKRYRLERTLIVLSERA